MLYVKVPCLGDDFFLAPGSKAQKTYFQLSWRRYHPFNLAWPYGKALSEYLPTFWNSLLCKLSISPQLCSRKIYHSASNHYHSHIFIIMTLPAIKQWQPIIIITLPAIIIIVLPLFNINTFFRSSLSVLRLITFAIIIIIALKHLINHRVTT